MKQTLLPSFNDYERIVNSLVRNAIPIAASDSNNNWKAMKCRFHLFFSSFQDDVKRITVTFIDVHSYCIMESVSL